MAQIGTIVNATEVPPSATNTANTANAFMVGFADWGPVGASGVNATAATSLTQVAAIIGPPNGGLLQDSRTATNATLYDSSDAYFRESGGAMYVSRVVGPNPSLGSLNLLDSTGGTSATLTAAYVGTGSSAINAVVVNSGASYVITLQDVAGNVLSASPSLSNGNPKTDLVTWAATTRLVTATTGNANLPTSVGTIGGTSTNPLSVGADDRGNALIADWSRAINGGLPNSLGPGQIMAPGKTNTALPGIWQALASNAQDANRIALLDATDGNSAGQAIAEVVAAAVPISLQSFCGLWAGNLQIPGIASGTTRIIPPSPVVAALCSRVDNLGNPNIAAAGTNYPLRYVSGINTAYTDPLFGDIATLNDHGINVFTVQFQVLQNYGFVSLISPSADSIYWELSHGRLRMAIVSQAAVVSQPFIFSQVDGQGQTTAAFGGTLSGMLLGYYQTGALYGPTATDAFSVNVSDSINTPSSLAAGNLIAQIGVRMSPFAQLVEIAINAVPITQALA